MSAIGIFCIGSYFLIRGIQADMIFWGLPLFILNFLVGLAALHYYLKSRYVPVAVAGPDWIIIKQGTGNRFIFTAESSIKDIKIANSDIELVRNGIFSITICTTNGYRYFLHGLSEQDRESFLKNLK